MNQPFVIEESTSELRVRVFGSDLNQLFKNAMLSMFSGMGFAKETLKVGPKNHEISLKSSDLEGLLVDFLTEILFLHSQHNEVYGDVAFESLDAHGLKAKVFGQDAPHLPALEIKAITFHELHIVFNDAFKRFETPIIFDI